MKKYSTIKREIKCRRVDEKKKKGGINEQTEEQIIGRNSSCERR